MRVAVPTDDGRHVARRFGRARAFVVTDVDQGQIAPSDVRPNPMSATSDPPPKTRFRASHKTFRPHRHQMLLDLLADCRSVIVYGISEPLRHLLFSRGIEVVFTSEELVDRVLALFSVGALRDESRSDEAPLDDGSDGWDATRFGTGDDYDA